MAVNSAYFEAIRQKDYDVVFIYEPYDEMILLQLNQFKKKNLSSIEQENVVDKNKDDLIIEGKLINKENYFKKLIIIDKCVFFKIGDTRSLSNSEAQELKAWFKTTLSKKIKNVKVIRIKY